MGILETNRENIISAIQSFRNSLDLIESALHNENYGQLEVMLDRSRSAYQSLISSP